MIFPNYGFPDGKNSTEYLLIELTAITRSNVLLTVIAVNKLTITPKAKVAEKLCTIVAPNVSANQNNIAHVINVDTLPSLIAGHARLKPMFIEDNNVRPALSSSFIRSNIRIFASTAIPIESIVAATPDNSRVIPINLNIANNRVAYIKRASPAINPGMR